MSLHKRGSHYGLKQGVSYESLVGLPVPYCFFPLNCSTVGTGGNLGVVAVGKHRKLDFFED